MGTLRTVHCAAGALVLSTLTGCVASAQAQGMVEYWTELQMAPTLAAVHAVPAPVMTDASAAGAAADGLKRIRLYELSFHSPVAREARRLLERTVERSPSSAWAHFALGVALARGPDVRVRPYDDRSEYFIDPNSIAASRAPRELRRAIELDPTLDAAAFELGRLALDLVDRGLMVEATRALERPSLHDDPTSQLLRAQLFDRLGSSRRAGALAERAASNGADRSEAAHVAAAAWFRVPGAEAHAADIWFSGLDMLSAAGLAAYWDAVRAVVTPAEAARWLAGDAGDRRDVLLRFWDMRAALAGVSTTERMGAHYTRLADVRARPRYQSMMGFEAAGEGFGPDVRSLGVANVGELSLLRHGDPQRMDRLLYCGPEIDTLSVALQPTVDQCKASPNGRYTTILLRDSGAMRLLKARARMAATTGESYYPPYLTHLALAWQAWRFRAPAGATAVVAALSLPPSAVQALRDSAGSLAAELAITIADTSSGRIRRERMRVLAEPGDLGPESRTILHIETTADSGRAMALRVGVENADRSAGRIVAGEIDALMADVDSLLVSDIVIGPRDGRRTFRRGDAQLTLAPHRVFRTGEPFDLFYEIYGISEGTMVETEILVSPVRDGLMDRIGSWLGQDDDVIRLIFHEPAPAPHPVFGLQQIRTVTSENMPPGDYRVRITVTDTETGRSTTRESILRIGRGAG